MATNTYVATTIAARYTPNVGAVDAFIWTAASVAKERNILLI